MQDLSNLPETGILVCFDVFGLYTHIRHKEGIETMVEYLETREDRSVSTRSLCGLARIVLKENNFEVSNKISHQQLVIAISTKFSPLTPTFLWLV